MNKKRRQSKNTITKKQRFDHTEFEAIIKEKHVINVFLFAPYLIIQSRLIHVFQFLL